jgi:tRNA pseudouridine55 synthase
MVSAVQVGGRRLHELARQGVEVERAPRPVTVHRFELEATADPGVLRCEVACSSGTYIRTLADDLGRRLGGGAHLRRLRRTAVGSFTEHEARPLEDLQLLTPAAAMRDHPSWVVDEATAVLVRSGRPLELPRDGDGPWAVLDRAGALLAVYESDGARARPAVVLAG